MAQAVSPLSGRIRAALFSRAAQLPGQLNLALADLLARSQLPRDVIPVPGSRFNVPEESFVAPAGVDVPPDARVFISPQFSRGEGAQIGRNVVFGGRVYPGQLAHELVHVAQDRRYGPLAQSIYYFLDEINKARGRRAYVDNPFEIEAEQARHEFERKAAVAGAYQSQRAGERRGR